MILKKKIFVKSMILKYKFFILPNLESTFLQRVRFWINIFTTRQFFKKKYIFRRHDFEEKFFSKKHDFEEKN